MTGRKNIFFEMPCLTMEKKLNVSELEKYWFKKLDKRYLTKYLQKFIDYNSEQLEFVGVKATVIGYDRAAALSFDSTNFVGTVPLRSPGTGLQIGDFAVTPRFSDKEGKYAQYIEILNLLGDSVSPEFMDSLPLVSGRNFRPPLYLEAVRFINRLEKLLNKPWLKFDNIESVQNHPVGQVNWTKYIINEYKIENRLKFPTRTNVTSEFHKEYANIRFVFDLCKVELLSANTPLRLRESFRSRLMSIEHRLYQHRPQKTKNIRINLSDSAIVKECKTQANVILNHELKIGIAWRVDFADVFEKFVQYIFNKVSKETGWALYPNKKFVANTKKLFSWELKYVEPDAILVKNDISVYVDAKYKSNLYNKNGKTKELKENYRRDLHQIMAYTSFNTKPNKCGFLCYPSEKIEIKCTNYGSTGINGKNLIFIVGIPFNIGDINSSIECLKNELSKIESLVNEDV